MWEKMLEAVDSEDKSELISLFSITATKDNPDFKNQIDAFFQAYKGPMEISNIKARIGSSSDSTDYGKRYTEINGGTDEDTILIAGGVRYHVNMKICSRDDFDKENEGILRLEIVTDEAYNSKYFSWHGSSLGFYYQDSTEKRDDIMWIEGRPLDYTHYDRILTTDELIKAVKMNDEIEAFVEAVGEPNCIRETYGYYYYELENGLFAVCKLSMDTRYDPDQKRIIKSNTIIAIYTADEKEAFETVWMADDIIRICGSYHQYTPVPGRELSEEIFVDFATRSNSYDQLIKEIGPPDAGRDTLISDRYYQISENRFVACDVRDGKDGKVIVAMYVVNSEERLYKLWERKE